MSTTPRTDSAPPLGGLNSGGPDEIKRGRGGCRPGAGRPPRPKALRPPAEEALAERLWTVTALFLGMQAATPADVVNALAGLQKRARALQRESE
jgi:hypothetical protein